MYTRLFNTLIEPDFATKTASRGSLQRAADITSRGGMGLGLGIAGAGLGGLGGLLAAGGHEVFVNESPLLDKSLLSFKGFGPEGKEFGLSEPLKSRVSSTTGKVRYKDFQDVLNADRLAKIRNLTAAGGVSGGLAGVLAGARGGLPAITKQNLAKTLAYGLPLGALGLAAGGVGGHLAGQLIEGPLSLGNMSHALEEGGVRLTKADLKNLKSIGDLGPTGKILQGLGAGAGLGGGIGLGASLARGDVIKRLAADARGTAKGFRAAPVASSLKSLAVGAPLALAGAGLGGLAGNLSAHGLEAYLHPETFDNLGANIEKAVAKPTTLYKKPLMDFFVPKAYEIGKPTVKALTYGGAGLGALAGLGGAARLTRGSSLELLKKIISRGRR